MTTTHPDLLPRFIVKGHTGTMTRVGRNHYTGACSCGGWADEVNAPNAKNLIWISHQRHKQQVQAGITITPADMAKALADASDKPAKPRKPRKDTHALATRHADGSITVTFGGETWTTTPTREVNVAVVGYKPDGTPAYNLSKNQKAAANYIRAWERDGWTKVSAFPIWSDTVTTS